MLLVSHLQSDFNVFCIAWQHWLLGLSHVQLIQLHDYILCVGIIRVRLVSTITLIDKFLGVIIPILLRLRKEFLDWVAEPMPDGLDETRILLTNLEAWREHAQGHTCCRTMPSI